MLNSNRKKKKNKATVARGIDDTSNAVQFNGFLGRDFIFINLFSQSATSPAYLFVSLFICQPTSFILLFFSTEYFSRF